LRLAASYRPTIALLAISFSASDIGSVLIAFLIHLSAHGPSCALCSSVSSYFLVRDISDLLWVVLSLSQYAVRPRRQSDRPMLLVSQNGAAQ
jgi:hypothetical protein